MITIQLFDITDPAITPTAVIEMPQCPAKDSTIQLPQLRYKVMAVNWTVVAGTWTARLKVTPDIQRT